MESTEAGWSSGVGGLGVGGAGVRGFGADVRSCVGGVLGANVGEIPLNRKMTAIIADAVTQAIILSVREHSHARLTYLGPQLPHWLRKRMSSRVIPTFCPSQRTYRAMPCGGVFALGHH